MNNWNWNESEDEIELSDLENDDNILARGIPIEDNTDDVSVIASCSNSCTSSNYVNPEQAVSPVVPPNNTPPKLNLTSVLKWKN